MDMVKDLLMEPPAITSLGGSLTSTEEVNSSQKQKRARKKKKKHGKTGEFKDKGPDFSLDNSSLKTDATIKDTLHESPALPDLLSSQRIVELSLTKKNKKRKRKKTKHIAIESNFNGCGALKDTLSSKTFTPAERGINDNSSIPEDKSGLVKNATLVKKHDDYQPPAIYHFSNKFQYAKTYKRRKRVNSNYGRNSGYPGPVNCKKKPTMQDHYKDDSHNFSDGHVTVGLMEKETKLSRDQVISHSGAAAEEMKLMTENTSEQRFVTKSSVVDIPVVQREETNGRQQDHTEVTRNDLCCAGDAADLSLVSINDCHSKICSENTSEQRFVTTSSVVDIPAVQLEETNGRHLDHTEIARNDLCRTGDAADLSLVSINDDHSKICSENTSEQRFVTTSSVVDIPVVQLEETSGRQLDHTRITRNELCCAGDAAGLSLVSIKDGHSKISHFSLDTTIISNSKKKLLVLDVNGLLADFVSYVPRGYKRQPDLSLKRRKVFKRPFCDDFLQFCFDRFHVGIWSSRAKGNVDKVIEFLMGKSASKLLFCWSQSDCTRTKFSTVENRDKPLVLKELRKLWEKLEPGLPWEKGEFNESNTLLLDDSPYKALGNPMYTAIFPYSYQFNDIRDTSLGPAGDLRVYLEGLAMAENVQEYVSSNPFGQRAITESNPSWGYYRKVIEALKCSQNARPSSPARE